ncbi:MAG: efflux RND transporter periplasmic adaptor subunit [Bacteroidales bacterium]|nr:efflux RND transporter periplasmic adaptor subunit [Bacteroidales bacterium]
MNLRFLMKACSLPLLVWGLSACSPKQKNQSEPTGKLQYTPAHNMVDVMPLRRTTFQWQLVANGRLSASSRSSLSFRSPGVLSSVKAENGQWVRKGTLIASTDDAEKRIALRSAKIAFAKAEIDYRDILAGQGYKPDAKSIPEEIAAMAKVRSGYDAAQNSLERAQMDLDNTRLTAPFDGKVADIKKKSYDAVGTDVFCSIIDDRYFDVDFSVLESEYPHITKDLAVKVIPFGSSEEPISGKILYVNPSVDKNGQVQVRARIPGSGLLDGMNVKVIVEKPVPDVLVVPRSAVVIRDGLEVLFVYDGGAARWVYVHTLMANSDSFVVEANSDRGARLSEGDSVIVSGNLNLADGSQVELK